MGGALGAELARQLTTSLGEREVEGLLVFETRGMAGVARGSLPVTKGLTSLQDVLHRQEFPQRAILNQCVQIFARNLHGSGQALRWAQIRGRLVLGGLFPH